MSLTCQIFLISICAFLHLAPGDATKCLVCYALEELGPCELGEDCEVDENGACASGRVYENEELVRLARGCWPDRNYLCGGKDEDPEMKTTVEVKCCDGDYCNRDL